jgi:SAM-dependent methyltransferase
MSAAVQTSGPAAARVSEHWGKQHARNAAEPSHWINNQLISAHLDRLVTGGESTYWLQWLLCDYLRDRPTIGRSLSVCCGDGAHELLLHASRKVQFVRGFDISEGALEQAREKFRRAGADPGSFLFEVRDANDLRLDDDPFDLILSTGALHHVTELEDLLDKLHALLAPDGYFVLLEYVGPNRFQWTDRQCELINGVLAQLDPRYLRRGRRPTLYPPPIPALMAVDPSEAVRSEDVLPLVRERFRVEYEAQFNGTLMHMLYPQLNAKLANRGRRDFDSIVRLLLFFEDVLIRSGVLASDFAFLICRRKDEAGRRPGGVVAHAGYVDACTPDEVTGWAADLWRPNNTLFVDVRVDGQRVGRVFCDGYRNDVRATGVGNGLCAFAFRFPPGRQPAPGSRVEVFVSGTDVLVGSAVVTAA